MPGTAAKRAIESGSRRLPGLRRLPVLKLLAAAEIVVLAAEHVAKLEPHERRRVVELVRLGRGRRRNLTQAEREELARLIEKAELREFLGSAASKLSPIPLPRRLVRGRSANARP
jgi:hypothetical protein